MTGNIPKGLKSACALLVCTLWAVAGLIGCSSSGPSKPSVALLEKQLNDDIQYWFSQDGTLSCISSISNIQWESKSNVARADLKVTNIFQLFVTEESYACLLNFNENENAWELSEANCLSQTADFSKLNGTWSCDYNGEAYTVAFSNAGIYTREHTDSVDNEKNASAYVEHNMGEEYNSGQLEIVRRVQTFWSGDDGLSSWIIELNNQLGDLRDIYIFENDLYLAPPDMGGAKMARIS